MRICAGDLLNRPPVEALDEGGARGRQPAAASPAARPSKQEGLQARTAKPQRGESGRGIRRDAWLAT
eukprot:8823914-Pyramimonas_sp.AAC.1